MEDLIWRKSSRSSTNGGQCVEIADNLPYVVVVRDSKDPNGPAIEFSTTDWMNFIRYIKTL